MLAVACSKAPALETCSDSVWYFISFNAEYLRCKGVCHDSQTDPLDAPLDCSLVSIDKNLAKYYHLIIWAQGQVKCAKVA